MTMINIIINTVCRRLDDVMAVIDDHDAAAGRQPATIRIMKESSIKLLLLLVRIPAPAATIITIVIRNYYS